MKKVKNIFAALICALLALLLCACSAKDLGALAGKLPPPAVTETEPPAETPAEAVEKEPESTPTPAPTPQPEIYIVRVEGTPYRSVPKTEEVNVLGTMPAGTKVTCVEDDGEFMMIKLEDGQLVWCNSWFLEAEDKELQEQRARAYLEERTLRKGYIAMADEPLYNCTATVLNCRSEPSTTSTILYQIIMGTKVSVLGRDGDFYLCRLEDGGIVYCSVNYLSSDETYVALEGAVDLRVFMPGAEFELLFASPNNVTGKALYPAIPLLEETTANMLMEAYEIFSADGYTLKICDAYRPKSAQIKLYDVVLDSRFIANPYVGNSWHQLGRAVDMTLVNTETGEEVEMPTPMHTFSTDASRSSRAEWSEEAQKNVDYMTEVMTSVGFRKLETEWWHFENAGSGGMMDNDIDMTKLPMRPVSEYVPVS